MLHKETYTHINFYDLLEEVEKIDNEDFEAKFMEYYQPCSECSIQAYLPNEDELEAYDWDNWQRAMFSTLNENGFYPGDSIYIDIDY